MSGNQLIHRIVSNKWKFLISLFTVGLALYSYTLNTGYFSDDFGFVEEIQQHNWDSFSRNFGDKFFIPLSHLFGFILYKISFGSPLLMHLTQVVVHILVSFQLYLLIKELGGKVQSSAKTISIAALAAIFFLVHPYQTEAVVWLAAKSYGYGLLFSLLSIRYLFKTAPSDFLKSMVFLLLAIHCKESAYFIPLTVLILSLLFRQKIEKKWWIGWSVVIIGSLILRCVVLGELIGGYGSEVHGQMHPLILLIVGLAYAFKFINIYKGESIYFVEFWYYFMIPFLLTSAYFIHKTNHIRKFNLWILLVISLLIPVLNLEISSISSVSTDRYSYFALTAVCFGFGYVLLSISSKVSRFLIPTLIGVFITFNLNYQGVWKKSAEVRDAYLSEVKLNIKEGENVMIVNIPDRAYGAYCLKNAPEDYMRSLGIYSNIEFYLHQNITDLISGVALTRIGKEGLVWLRNYPDLSAAGRVFFDENWLDEFDKVFIYQEGKLIRITEEYLKSVPLDQEL